MLEHLPPCPPAPPMRAVAMEIAMVLESWGHQVGMVLVSRRAACPHQPELRQCQAAGALHRTPPHRFGSQSAHATCPPPSLPPSWPPQIMDTPRPDQVRRARPEAEAATEEDSMELMEMILGALGKLVWGFSKGI